MTAALGLVAGVAAGTLQAQQVVYDNTARAQPIFYRFSREHGDEIELAGTSRRVTEFLFQYSGDFALQTAADYQIRFYANDGEPSFSGHPSALAPRSVLWESGWRRMIPGPQVDALPVPSVLVPDRFTWTVQFRGVEGSVGNAAGLILADPPSVGRPLADGKVGSYWDAWIRDPMGPGGPEWGLINFGFKPEDAKANFFARVTATARPQGPEATAGWQAGGAVVRWPALAGQRYRVEVAGEFPPRAWELLQEVTAAGAEAQVGDDREGGQRFYRVQQVVSLPGPPVTILRPAGRTVIRWPARPGGRYQVEVADTFPPLAWRGLAEVEAPGGGGMAEAEDAGDPAQRFFRVREITLRPGPRAVVSRRPAGMRVTWPTREGVHYQVEVADSLTSTGWRLLDEMSGTGALAEVVDPGGTGPRFYRVREAEPLTLVPLSTGLTLRWTTRAGRYYRVEMADAVPSGAWRLRGQSLGEGGLTWWGETDAVAQRFYRVWETDEPELVNLSINRLPAGAALDWAAEPGRRYVIEYRTGASGPWKMLERPRASGTALGHWDPPGAAGSHREYRVWMER
ncbi:MAG: hypothetical protein ACKO3N_14295 [Verrucomicrobiota bacterium]